MRTALLVAVLALAGTAHATSRADVRDDAQAVIARTEQCEHDPATVKAAYLQTRKAVSVVQMTTALPYAFNPTEGDVAAMAARVLPLPRTTNGRLLAEGEAWFEAALATLSSEACE